MAVAIAASSAGGTDEAANITVEIPGSAAVGLCLIYLSSTDTAATWSLTTGTGWTELIDSVGQAWWYKEISAVETNPGFTPSVTGLPVAYNVWRLTGYATGATHDVSVVQQGTDDLIEWPALTVTSGPYSGMVFLAVGIMDGRRQLLPPYPDGYDDIVTSEQVGTGAASIRVDSVTANVTGIDSVLAQEGGLSGNAPWRTTTVFVRESGTGSYVIEPEATTVTVTPGNLVVSTTETVNRIGHSFLVDWAGDGFNGDDNETERVRLAARIDRGVDTNNPIPTIMTSTAQFTLNNDDNRFHPWNTLSVLDGELLPGRQAKIKATWNDVDYVLFRGGLYSFDVQSSPESRAVDLSFLGPLHRLANTKVSTTLKRGITTGTAIEAVLDAAGRNSNRRALDVGSTILPVWWAYQETALSALTKLLAVEGPPAAIFDDGEGDIVFHDRHHRQDDVATTWRDSGTEPVYLMPSRFDQGWDSVTNDVTVNYNVYERQRRQVVWRYGEQTLTIPAGGELTVTAEFPVPTANPRFFFDQVWDNEFVIDGPQLGVTDLEYTARSATATFLSAGLNPDKVTLKNVLIKGNPYELVSSRTKTATDTDSQDDYETRSITIASDHISSVWAKDLARSYRNFYADPLPSMSVVLSNGDDDRTDDMMTIDINDRVTVTLAEIQTGGDFYVQRISTDINEAGLYQRTIYEVRQQPAFEVDPDELGRFDSGTFENAKFGR